jgi:hypothetical protein
MYGCVCMCACVHNSILLRHGNTVPKVSQRDVPRVSRLIVTTCYDSRFFFCFRLGLLAFPCLCFSAYSFVSSNATNYKKKKVRRQVGERLDGCAVVFTGYDRSCLFSPLLFNAWRRLWPPKKPGTTVLVVDVGDSTMRTRRYRLLLHAIDVIHTHMKKKKKQCFHARLVACAVSAPRTDSRGVALTADIFTPSTVGF